MHKHVPEAIKMLVQSNQFFVLTATYLLNYFGKMLQGNHGSIGNVGYFTVKSADIMRIKKEIVPSKIGKAIPLQAWTGPEGSRRLSFPDFKTFDT